MAALYDIHGNVPALQAVLNELEQIQPDVIVLGGDMVSGPMPAQTLERLQQLTGKVLALRGNADREVVVACTGAIATLNLPEEVAEITQWTAQCLKPEQRDVLAHLPESVTLGPVWFIKPEDRCEEIQGNGPTLLIQKKQTAILCETGANTGYSVSITPWLARTGEKAALLFPVPPGALSNDTLFA